jgi:hypothetical protein
MPSITLHGKQFDPALWRDSVRAFRVRRFAAARSIISSSNIICTAGRERIVALLGGPTPNGLLQGVDLDPSGRVGQAQVATD